MTSLAGKRIVITRPREQADTLFRKLAALGARPILFPTIRIAPMDDYSALDKALGQLDQYQWIIFTSANGVAMFWDRLQHLEVEASFSSPVAAIGPATAHALEQRGVRPAYMPEEYVAEALADGLGDMAGQWVLLPRADIAREALADQLSARGATVHEIAIYRTLPAAPDLEGLAALREGVDVVTFTSSSTVRNFVRLLNGSEPPSEPASLLRPPRAADDNSAAPARALVACIGPITAQTAREAGLPVDIVADDYTTDGLIAALLDYFDQPEPRLKENA